MTRSPEELAQAMLDYAAEVLHDDSMGDEVHATESELDESVSRSSGFIDGQALPQVTVIGAGMVGSHVAYQLAMLGVITTVFDGDKVSDANLESQMYQMEHVSMNKGVALARQFDIIDFPVMWPPQRKYALDVVVSCPDTMAARQEVYQSWGGDVGRLLIDVRCAGELMFVYQVYDYDTQLAYQDQLPNDDEVQPIPC